MTAPAPNANGQRPVSNVAVGSGDASETIMETNGTYSIPEGFKLQITDWLAYYQGVGTINVRVGSLTGPIKLPLYFAAAGEIQGDVTTPIEIPAPLGGGDVPIVFTEQGNFPNSFTFSGLLVSIGG
jgi:hypothetical protein